MSKTDLSILVVDDTKFSSAIVSKTLVKAGYEDLRTAKSAAEALDLIRDRAIDILLADWIMPEMDGLELTSKIRELDTATGNYTYVILLTAKEGVDAISTAFDAGVDEFINKSIMKEQLIPRFLAAERLVKRHNKLVDRIRKLSAANQQLEALNTVDALTGIGNEKYTEVRIDDALDFVESRGGAMCYIHFQLLDIDKLKEQYRPVVFDQLIVLISKRLQQLFRPMDGLTRLSEGEFGVIQHQKDISICDGQIFKRIMDGINIKPYETEAGYVSIKVCGSLVGVDANVEFFPDAKAVIRETRERIDTDNTEVINTFHWHNIS